MKLGILLFNLGGPEKLEDVKPFLYQLFSDPEIVHVKWSPLRKAIAYTIATLRRKTSEGYYRQIGGGSPLRRLTQEQADALKDEFRKRGREVDTWIGMCTWNPFLDEVWKQIERTDIDTLVVLPLFPHYSVTTTGSGFRVLKELAGQGRFKETQLRWVRSWHDRPTYIEAFAQSIQRELKKFANPEKVHLLFSAHSIPESYVTKGDPYLDQTKKSVELIMDKLGRRNPYQLSFQSKIGPVKWLDPFTNDAILKLGKEGIADVLVIPISFVSEHIETLYELDILYKKVAKDAGIVNFRRVPALNSDPTFIRALAEIVESEIST
jgi:ferrochelatase